jgi:predicted PurR-regulated permease PerM
MRVDLNLGALLAYGVVLGILSWKVAAPFWGYLLLGLLIAVLAFPLHERLRGWTEHEKLSGAITVTLALLLVIVPVSVLAWLVVRQMQALLAGFTAEDATEGLQDAMEWSNATFGVPRDVEPDAAQQLIADEVPQAQEALAAWGVDALASAGEFVLGMLLMVVLAYYGLVHGQIFLSRLKDASPMEDDLEEYFYTQTKLTIDGVIWGQIVTSALQGVLGAIAFWIVGIPSAVFWGFVMALLAFLPLIGAFAVWVPAAVYLFAIGNTAFAIGLLVWGVIVVSLVDDVVRPYVIGRSAALHPVLAFVGVLGGLVAFGIMGFVLGPLVLSLFAVVFDVLADSEWNLDDWEPPGEEPDEDTGEPSPS